MAKGFKDSKGNFHPTDGNVEFGIPRRSTKRKSVDVGTGRRQEIQMARIQKRFPNDAPQADPIGNISSTERMLAEAEVDSEIENVGFDDNLYEFENKQEWWIFTDFEKAKQRAIQQEVDLLETEETIAGDLAKRFPNEEFIFITDTDKRIISAEQGDFAVEDREPSELISMADDFQLKIDPKLIDKFSEGEEDSDFIDLVDRLREDVASAISSDVEDKLDNPVKYFVEEEGIYNVEDLLKQNFIRTDIDKMAEFVIDSDGVSNTLAGYDGNEIVVNDKDNKERLYMYRAN